ncbi:MAG: YggS family pyridoxal phosphate-dependent enzyme [Nannocystaceae bacterium]
MIPVTPISERVARVQEQIERAKARRGPGPQVTVVAASKRQPVEAILSALDAGLQDFGENYAQEFRRKGDAISRAELRWHFIGALQTNKAGLVAGRALIHTVDRVRLIDALEAKTAQLTTAVIQPVLIEVNFGEAQKAGVESAGVPLLLAALDAAPHLRCDGLMTIPPTGTPEHTRAHFVRLRQLRDKVQACTDAKLHHLSMGMSADYDVAIEEGASIIRVGTAIFGPRPAASG